MNGYSVEHLQMTTSVISSIKYTKKEKFLELSGLLSKRKQFNFRYLRAITTTIFKLARSKSTTKTVEKV